MKMGFADQQARIASIRVEGLLPVSTNFVSAWHPIEKFYDKLSLDPDHTEELVFRTTVARGKKKQTKARGRV